MASEIRVDKINSLSGVGTVTLSPTGVDIAGITTVATINVDDKILHTGDTDTAIRFPESNHISMETASNERLRIKGNGNIGIGTDNPNNRLHVYGGQLKAQSSTDNTDTNVDLIRAQCGSSGNALFSVRAADAADNNSDWDIKTNAGEELSFTIGGAAEKARITSDGELGIGTTNPSDNIHVSESGATNNYIRFSNSNVANGWSLGARGSDGRFQIVQNGVADRFSIDTSGNISILNGNLVIGTAGKGIDFSAQTASSASGATTGGEVLDHYEEGDWTPVIAFGGSSTGITYTARDGAYTRIGRQVTITFMVELSSKGSSTGDATITGLPFTVADLISNTIIEASGSAGYWNNIDPDLMWMAFTAETVGGGQLSIRYQPETGASDAVDALDNANFTNSTNFRGTVTYFTS